MQVKAVILAAGQGTRMKSAVPKVLHHLGGQPLVAYSIRTAQAVTGDRPVLVVGHGSEQVRLVLGDQVAYAEQTQQLGTGHAVMQTRPLLEGKSEFILVTYADMPLLSAGTLERLIVSHQQGSAVISMLTVVAEDPRGFGRIIRGAGGVQAIVEEAACTPEQLAIKELNAGVYCFTAGWLWQSLAELPLSAKGEYYLTDLIGIAVGQGERVNAVACDNASEVMGINTRAHLAEAEQLLRAQINRYWMEAGVTLLDPANTYIDSTVAIGQDTVVLPNTYLWGRTTIGSNCRIGPSSTIQDSQVGDNCVVTMSVLEGATMEEDSNIGPFSHLRKGARVCRGAHVGNFGEIKNSTLGPGAKMGHFSYLGDASVGSNVNIGCGTITCNFDGENKHPTIIEDDVFIASDTMLVAPVRIGRGARTGAGAVVTHDIPDGALAYGVPARVKRMPNDTSEERAEE